MKIIGIYSIYTLAQIEEIILYILHIAYSHSGAYATPPDIMFTPSVNTIHIIITHFCEKCNSF